MLLYKGIMPSTLPLRCATVQRNYAVDTAIVTSESQNKQNINLFLIVMREHGGGGGAMAQSVEAGRSRFDSRWARWAFSLT